MVIPAGSHPDALFMEKKKEQQWLAKLKKTQDENWRRAEEENWWNLWTPEPFDGRLNIET